MVVFEQEVEALDARIIAAVQRIPQGECSGTAMAIRELAGVMRDTIRLIDEGGTVLLDRAKDFSSDLVSDHYRNDH